MADVPRRGKSEKRRLIGELFESLRTSNPDKSVILFDNQQVKHITGDTFANQFDATKFDSRDILPEVMKKEGWFILHLGRGNHVFIKGEGYHELEPIGDTRSLRAAGSVLDRIGRSEASAISTLYNERIINEFLSGTKDAEIKVHTARRTKVSFAFRIGSSRLSVDGLQLEIDGFFETTSYVAAVEVKSGQRGEFEIRQLFCPMKYLDEFKSRGVIPNHIQIRLLYVNRYVEEETDVFSIYEYRFSDPEDLNSIELVRSVRYRLEYDVTSLTSNHHQRKL